MLMSGQDDKVKSECGFVLLKCLRSKSMEQYPSPRKCLSYTARKRKSLGFILGTISFLACAAGEGINLCTKKNGGVGREGGGSADDTLINDVCT